MKKFPRRSSIWMVLLSVPSLLVSNPHFYRPENFMHQPIPYKDEVLRLNVSFFGGNTTKGRNASGEVTDVLNIYGPHNIRTLAANVMTAKLPLTNIAALPAVAGTDLTIFGQFQFAGTFSYGAAYLEAVRCLHKNWFLQGILPIQWLRIGNVSYTDLTPLDGNGVYNQQNATLIDVKTYPGGMDGLLDINRLTASTSSATYIGDTTVYVGYAWENTALRRFDHVRLSAKGGILFPTAKRKNEDQAFSVPGGYDGHFGLPFSFDGYIGNPKLHIGGHLGGFWFFKHTKEMRVKTNLEQNGFIKLAKGSVTRNLGTIFTGGAFIRLRGDHMGFSFGYSYARQGESRLTPRGIQTDSRYAATERVGGTQFNFIRFSPDIINSDDMLKKWVMQAFHINFEYHRSEEDYEGFTAKIFYNRPITGKRIFNTHTIGAGCGASVLWKF